MLISYPATSNVYKFLSIWNYSTLFKGTWSTFFMINSLFFPIFDVWVFVYYDKLKFESQWSCHKRDTELTILCYVNKSDSMFFVYILSPKRSYKLSYLNVTKTKKLLFICVYYELTRKKTAWKTTFTSIHIYFIYILQT